MREIQRDIVAALIHSQEGKVLMGKKDPYKGGVYNDCWHIPGGGINEDEDQIDALKREVHEETGIVITNEIIELIDDKGYGSSEKVLKESGEKVICNMRFYIYKIQIAKLSSEILPKASDDLVELRWFNRDELVNVKLTPPSQELFQRLKYT